MKTALVTGANKGIGFQIARQLSGKGYHVFLTARRAKAGEEAVAKLTQQGGKVSFLEMDVSQAASVQKAAQEFAKLADRLDVLVNNAGIVVEGDADVLTFPEESVRKTLETNTLGPLRVTRAFAELLGKGGEPRVINLSSGAGQLTDGADGWAPAYCISKTALNGVTSQLAAALKKVAVNSVCPGWVHTEMGGSSAPRTPEQGADTIVWLATEAPPSLTGQFLRDREQIPW